MCDLTLALALGSTVLGAAGQVQQASAQSSADKYNAQVAAMNAKIESDKAKDAIERGAQQEQQKRLATSQLMGKQRAALAASGVDLSFGSPLDTLIDTAKMGEVDALNIRTNSYREAYAYRVNSANSASQAEMYKSKAASDTAGGYLGAIGTILGGGSKAYGAYKSPGAPGYIN